MLWLLGCVGWHQVPAHPIPVDSSPQVLAIVGATSSPPPTGLLTDLQNQGVEVLVLAGDAVSASHPRAWSQVSRRWDSVATLDVVGAGERQGDSTLKGRAAVWPDVPTWGAFASSPHQILWLDAFDPVDQRFWLPKGAIPGERGGVVAVLGQASASVEAQFLDAVPGAAVAMLVRGGALGNAATLPAGPWSHLVLDVGPSSGGEWTPTTGSEVFHAALAAVFTEEYPAAVARLQPTSTLDGPFATAGWWKLTLLGDTMLLSLRRRGTDGVWHGAYEASWTKAGGWAQSLLDDDHTGPLLDDDDSTSP